MPQILAKGIDISKHQPTMDFVAAKKAGYSFVFLRVGYNKTKDKCFESHYAAAKAAGLKVGAYFYTISTTVEEATEDATRVLGWLNNRHLDYPVVYDLEDSKQKGASRKNINANMYLAFKEKIEKGNIYDAMLYTGEYFYNSYFNKDMIDDDLWIAKYSKTEPSVGRDIAIWQYTSSAISSDFYKKPLDRNYLYVGNFQGSRKPIAKPHPINPYPVPTRVLKKTAPMMRGNDVKWLQFELSIDVDGIFGSQTKEAVLLYQKTHELKQDGIVGSATRYSLLND